MTDEKIEFLNNSIGPETPNGDLWRKLIQYVKSEERAHEVTIAQRDAAEDAIQDTHIALGGDGEWVGRNPRPHPPESGDLCLDVPMLASEVMAELARLRDLWRWIPVGERLPEEGCLVGIRRQYKKNDVINCVIDRWSNLSLEWNRNLYVVTHWMPLPPDPEKP